MRLRKLSKSLDVLILSYIDYPGYTGMSKRIRGIVEVLKKRNISVLVLCPLFWYPQALSPMEGVNYIDLRFLRRFGFENRFTRLMATMLFSFIAFLRIVKNKPKIVQYQTIYSIVPAVLAKLLLNSKVVGDDITWDCFY